MHQNDNGIVIKQKAMPRIVETSANKAEHILEKKRKSKPSPFQDGAEGRESGRLAWWRGRGGGDRQYKRVYNAFVST